MGQIKVMNWVTLDGIMQAPGAPDEDTRNGFAFGGWATPFSDKTIGVTMGERMGSDHAWLFGRRTYEGVLAAWNDRGGPFKEALNSATKYVASRDPQTRLAWPNSTLLGDDVPAAVTDLKQSSDTNLIIMGSGVLIASLMAAELIDEYLLLIAPVVLGAGRRLFPEGIHASLTLLACTPTPSGAVIATYRSAAATSEFGQ